MARDDFRSDLYEPGEVYTGGAKDSQGHSTNIRCHIPDPWVAQIAEIVNSPDWPEYKTHQDFYRDAIFHRMKWASTQPDRLQSERVRSLMALNQGQAALSYATMVHDEAHRFIAQSRETINRLLNDQNHLGVRETLKELEAALDWMPEPFATQLATDLAVWEQRLNVA